MMTALIVAVALGQCSGGSCGMPSAGGGFGFSAMPSAFYATPAYAPSYAPPPVSYAAPSPSYAVQAPATTSTFRWSMQDASGKWWGDNDLAALVAHVDRTDARLASRTAPVVATRYVLVP